MKRAISILLLTSVSTVYAQSLPDAPSTTKTKQNQSVHTKKLVEPTEVVEPSHRGRTIALWAIVGGLLVGGLVAGLVTRGVNCPQHEYEGHPYSGRSPGCPKPEPGEKR